MEISSDWADTERLTVISTLAIHAMHSIVHHLDVRRAAETVECLYMVAHMSRDFLEANRAKIEAVFQDTRNASLS